MAAHKTAITIPQELLVRVDAAARERNESRSGFITRVLREAMRADCDARVTERLNAVFGEQELSEEQLRTSSDLELAGVAWDDERW